MGSGTRPARFDGTEILHNVHYVLNKRNPDASSQFMRLVKKHLIPLESSIAGVIIEVYKHRPKTRNVHMADGYCLSVTFRNQAAFDAYMVHPDHRQYCIELFRGWCLVGSQRDCDEAEKRVAEVVDRFILGNEQGLVITQDSEVDHSQRIYGGEQVADMEPIDLETAI